MTLEILVDVLLIAFSGASIGCAFGLGCFDGARVGLSVYLFYRVCSQPKKALVQK